MSTLKYRILKRPTAQMAFATKPKKVASKVVMLGFLAGEFRDQEKGSQGLETALLA